MKFITSLLLIIFISLFGLSISIDSLMASLINVETLNRGISEAITSNKSIQNELTKQGIDASSISDEVLNNPEVKNLFDSYIGEFGDSIANGTTENLQLSDAMLEQLGNTGISAIEAQSGTTLNETQKNEIMEKVKRNTETINKNIQQVATKFTQNSNPTFNFMLKMSGILKSTFFTLAMASGSVLMIALLFVQSKPKYHALPVLSASLCVSGVLIIILSPVVNFIFSITVLDQLKDIGDTAIGGLNISSILTYGIISLGVGILLGIAYGILSKLQNRER